MSKPVYPTIEALAEAVRSGVLDPSTFTLIVGNDSIYAWTNNAEVCLFSSGGADLTDFLVEHFRSMGLPAECA